MVPPITRSLRSRRRTRPRTIAIGWAAVLKPPIAIVIPSSTRSSACSSSTTTELRRGELTRAPR